MALAYLSLASARPDAVEFVADLGENGFFEYHVGDGGDTVRGRWGGEALERVAHTSRLLRGPEQRSPFDSRFRFSVPNELFSRDNRCVQLTSYKDAARGGAAHSRVIHVIPAPSGSGAYERGLPGRAMSVAEAAPSAGRVRFATARRVPLAFQESVLSEAQFVDGLLGAIQAVAPSVLEALPGLLSAITGGRASPASPASPGGAPAPIAARGGSAQGGVDIDGLVALLRQVVAALPRSGAGTGANVSPGPPAEPAPPPPAPAEATSLASREARARSAQRLLAKAVQMRRGGVSRAFDGGILSGPLLASLLGPLLSQAPQLLGVLADKPLDFLGTLIRNQNQTDLDREKNQQDHTRQLLAELNRSMLLDELVERMGGGAAALLPGLSGATSLARTRGAGAAPRESKKFALRFELGPALDVGGKLKSVYDASDGIVLVAVLGVHGDPPTAPLPKAIARLRLVDTLRHQPVLEKEFHLADLSPEAPIALELSRSELAGVPRQRDLHVEAFVRWPVRGGARGARADHAICLTDGVLLGRIGEEVGPEIALSDPQLHRAFWNKIWEGGLPVGSDASRFELDVVCRFYVRGVKGERSNGRMETRLRVEPRDPDDKTQRTAGRMRAGIELALDELNKLAQDRGGGLAPGDLEVLRATDLRRWFDLQATSRLRVRGKEGQIGVVWAFPSVRSRKVTLLEVVRSDLHGQVVETRSRAGTLPFPSSVHFLTLRSK